MCIRDRWLLGRPQRNWEFCLECETFFLFSVTPPIQGSHPPLYGVLLSYMCHCSGFIRLLDRVESKAKRLINCPVLSSSLDPLYLRCDVGALSLFYRYCTAKCSRELSTHVPPPLRRPRSTRGAVSAHEFCVDIGNSSLVRCGASFFPATSVQWNSIPSSVLHAEFNLPHFKACVCAHLRNLR